MYQRRARMDIGGMRIAGVGDERPAAIPGSTERGEQRRMDERRSSTLPPAGAAVQLQQASTTPWSVRLPILKRPALVGITFGQSKVGAIRGREPR